MVKTDYDFDKELNEEVAALIEDEGLSEFAAIRELGVVVLPCMRVRMADDGEAQKCSGDPVSIKKVGTLERLFMTKKPQFLVVVDYGAWSDANPYQRKIMLHRGLMRIAVEKTEEGTKLGTRKPDIVEFTKTIERFGAFTDNLLALRQAFRDSSHRLVPGVEPEAEAGAEPEAADETDPAVEEPPQEDDEVEVGADKSGDSE